MSSKKHPGESESILDEIATDQETLAKKARKPHASTRDKVVRELHEHMMVPTPRPEGRGVGPLKLFHNFRRHE